jgi:hypothetical protein
MFASSDEQSSFKDKVLILGDNIKFSAQSNLNYVHIEFHPDYFPVKDRIIGATMLLGRCQNGVYLLASHTAPDKFAANATEFHSGVQWH